MEEEIFYSKVILFGEYSMIFDATALMLPLRRYKAQWKMNPALDQPGKQASNKSIRKFRQYLSENEELSPMFDFQRFDADLDQGLYLDSDVPSGYGLGSSGVLTAAVYKRFAATPIKDLLELKGVFGKMESYFHGSSSGIDPLECYVNRAFIIDPERIAYLGEEFMPYGTHVFLVDTGIKSNTKPLVQYFKEKCEDPEYMKAFQTEYVPCVKACMQHLIKQEREEFFVSLRKLTDGQLKFLRPMITDNTIDLFLEKPDFHIGFKISGSGGGGYVLGITDSISKTLDFMKDYQLIWVR